MAADDAPRPGNGPHGDDGARVRTAVAVTEELLAEMRPGEAVRVTPSSALDRDLGLDSLSLMELRERLEEALGASIPDREVAQAETLADLLRTSEGEEPIAGTPSRPDGAEGAGVAAPTDASTLLDVLDWYAERHPDRLHLRLLDEHGLEGELSFEGLRAGAERVAAGLQGEGVGPGDTVALMLPTGLRYFETFFGVLLCGAVPVPIYPPARPSQLSDHVLRHAALLRNAEVRTLVTVAEARSVARLLRGHTPSLEAVVTAEDLAGAGGRATVVPRRPDDLALLQYTSGSTAVPKGVEVTHEMLFANLRAMDEVLRIDPASDVFVSWLPLYHDMGLIGAWFGSLALGMPLVVMSPLTFLSRPVRWLRAVHDHRGTVSAAPNFAYELCCARVRDAELEGLDLSSWRYALNGAEPVSADTIERFRDRYRPHGLRPEAICPVYGLAEATLGVTFPPPGRGPHIDRISRDRFHREGLAAPAAADDPDPLRIVGCGHPVPGHEVRIVDGREREAAEREHGRIRFRGPSATRGYHRNPEADRDLLHDGWLDTGDLGYLADGELHVTGRVKDLIIHAGRNLHPQDIEDEVGGIDGVRRGCVAAFAATDETTGTEHLVVVAETRTADEGTRSRLRDDVRAAVADVVGVPPDEVVLAPPRAVLKTSSGKVRRSATRERWEAGRIHKPAPHLWRQVLQLGPRAARTRLRHAAGACLRGGFGVLAWAVAAGVGLPTWAAVMALPHRGMRWRAARTGLRLVLRIIGVPLAVEGTERLPEGPYVVVAPHGSPLDGPTLVAALPHRLTFAVLEDVAHIPVVGRVLRRLGAELVDREDRARAVAGVDRLVAAAARGERPVLFPESTMSSLRGLRPFHMGAFVVAARAGVPVVPVGIEGAREIVGPDGRLPRPGALRVTVGEPVRPDGEGWAAAVALRDRTRGELLELLEVPDLART